MFLTNKKKYPLTSSVSPKEKEVICKAHGCGQEAVPAQALSQQAVRFSRYWLSGACIVSGDNICSHRRCAESGLVCWCKANHLFASTGFENMWILVFNRLKIGTVLPHFNQKQSQSRVAWHTTCSLYYALIVSVGFTLFLTMALQVVSHATLDGHILIIWRYLYNYFMNIYGTFMEHLWTFMSLAEFVDLIVRATLYSLTFIGIWSSGLECSLKRHVFCSNLLIEIHADWFLILSSWQ